MNESREARRWIRLDVGWENTEWLLDLSPGARLAWVLLLGYVKAMGVGGTVKALSMRAAAKNWGIPVADISALLRAASSPGDDGDDPALLVVDGTWTVAKWDAYQKPDPTAAERKRRQRRRESSPEEEHSPSQPVTRDNGVTRHATETLTLTGTETREVQGQDQPRRVDVENSNGEHPRPKPAPSPPATDPDPEYARPPTYTRAELLEEAKAQCGLGMWSTQETKSAGSVLRTWYGRGDSPERIYAAIHGVRQLADAGKVDWLPPRKPYGLKALNNTCCLADQGDGKAKRLLFDVAVEAFQRGEDSRAPPGKRGFGAQKVADLLAGGSR